MDNVMNGGFASLWLLFMFFAWAVPIVFAFWLFRAVSAMVAAQRTIAEQLTIIARQGRERLATHLD